MKKKKWDARKKIEPDMDAMIYELRKDMDRKYHLLEMRLAALEMRPVFMQVQPGEAWTDAPKKLVSCGMILKEVKP